ARAIIADVTKPGPERTKGYSRMQLLSGTFGVGAYFISVSFGNIALIYVAAALVLLFSVVPVFFVEEPRILQEKEESLTLKSKSSVTESLKVLFPLYGFAAFALYVIINKM